MKPLHALWLALRQSLQNLLPILGVVGLFQLALVRTVPEHLVPVLGGLLVVAAGIALFLRGLEEAVFPVGRTLANRFARRGSLPLLLGFGFSIGFAAVIAEPSLIAVAEKAQSVSEGRIHALLLRLLVACSAGAAVAIGLYRALRDQPIHYYLIGGYLLLLATTWVTPPEVTGLAFDVGAVSANLVTIPLLAALGLGLTSSLKGRPSLMDGFGLAALVVLAPRIVVQLYGLVVYAIAPDALAPVAEGSLRDAREGAMLSALLADLGGILLTLLPMVMVVLLFQRLVLRQPFVQPARLAGGLLLLVVGLLLFTEGLFIGLFPIGEHMARELAQIDNRVWVYLFVFLLGFAATLVEPALLAVAERAAALDPRRLNARLIRLMVALGVGGGLTLGVARLAHGFSLEWLLAGVVLTLLLLVLLAPRDLVAFGADLGGIATSDVTVPVITTLGVGLAAAFGSSNVMLDGFGLIALASLVPVIVVLLYAVITRKRAL